MTRRRKQEEEDKKKNKGRTRAGQQENKRRTRKGHEENKEKRKRITKGSQRTTTRLKKDKRRRRGRQEDDKKRTTKRRTRGPARAGDDQFLFSHDKRMIRPGHRAHLSSPATEFRSTAKRRTRPRHKAPATEFTELTAVTKRRTRGAQGLDTEPSQTVHRIQGRNQPEDKGRTRPAYKAQPQSPATEFRDAARPMSVASFFSPHLCVGF